MGAVIIANDALQEVLVRLASSRGFAIPLGSRGISRRRCSNYLYIRLRLNYLYTLDVNYRGLVLYLYIVSYIHKEKSSDPEISAVGEETPV